MGKESGHTPRVELLAPIPARSKLALVGRGPIVLAGLGADGLLAVSDTVFVGGGLVSVEALVGVSGLTVFEATTDMDEPGALRRAARLRRGACTSAHLVSARSCSMGLQSKEYPGI